MSEENVETHSRRLDVFKALSTFISTVIIALMGIFVANQYNNKQLEIAQKQVESQLTLTRLKEISILIPKLGSTDKNERKFSAIALGVYGKDAVPALIALLGDEDDQVRLASIKSLELIGKDAMINLEQVFVDKRNRSKVRSGSLLALGSIRAESAFKLARNTIEDIKENPFVRIEAAHVMGLLKDPNGVRPLLEALNKYLKNDIGLSRTVVWALGQIADPIAFQSLIPLLSNEDEELRYETVDALALIKGENVLQILSEVADRDKSSRVRDAAINAIEWVMLSQP